MGHGILTLQLSPLDTALDIFQYRRHRPTTSQHHLHLGSWAVVRCTGELSGVCQHQAAGDPSLQWVSSVQTQFESALSVLGPWPTNTGGSCSAVAAFFESIWHTWCMPGRLPSGMASTDGVVDVPLWILPPHIQYISLTGNSLLSNSMVARVLGIGFRCSDLTKQASKLVKTWSCLSCSL